MGVLESVATGERFALLPKTTVGRHSSSELQLSDPDVSHDQSIFRWDGAFWLVEDAGSKNGTMVDGRVLENRECVVLKEGAVVVFSGDQTWKLVDAGPPRYPMAIPLSGGNPIPAKDGVLTLPPTGDAEVHISSEGIRFVGRPGTAALDNEEVVVAGEKSYRILLT